MSLLKKVLVHKQVRPIAINHNHNRKKQNSQILMLKPCDIYIRSRSLEFRGNTRESRVTNAMLLGPYSSAKKLIKTSAVCGFEDVIYRVLCCTFRSQYVPLIHLQFMTDDLVTCILKNLRNYFTYSYDLLNFKYQLFRKI